MNAQRVGLRALRQVAAKQPNAIFTQTMPRLALASMQIRGAATTNKITSADAHTLLASQRAQRPVAPHLTVYDPKQTWFTSSIWTRITGSLFTGTLYAFSLSYLAAPLLGWHLESQSLAEAAAAMSPALKSGLKFFAAWPFVYHALNGTRHLVWDFALGFSKQAIRTTSRAVWGASVLGALGLVFLV
ncbi:succinate dehydrogenase cytochrome b560 subunit [Xylariomycetidae sp. FL0641]|nr:succinate dehydrogenase cytochrome b560 subunit [Xylariomycetidae sp. FL0641]